MNKGINNILIFTLGAAIGAGVTWKLVKTKYENIAKEEIDEIREYYAKKNSNMDDLACPDKFVESTEAEDNKVRDYNDIIKKEGYVDYSEVKKEEKGAVEESFEGPVLIPEDEFADNPEYSTETFIYYADDVLADQRNNVVNTADEIVGTEYVFAIEDEDVVYIRNDELEMYYEIIKDPGEFKDLFPKVPHEE